MSAEGPFLRQPWVRASWAQGLESRTDPSISVVPFSLLY